MLSSHPSIKQFTEASNCHVNPEENILGAPPTPPPQKNPGFNPGQTYLTRNFTIRVCSLCKINTLVMYRRQSRNLNCQQNDWITVKTINKPFPESYNDTALRKKWREGTRRYSLSLVGSCSKCRKGLRIGKKGKRGKGTGVGEYSLPLAWNLRAADFTCQAPWRSRDCRVIGKTHAHRGNSTYSTKAPQAHGWKYL